MLSAITLNCPKCGGTLNVENGRNQYFCPYCGSKIIIQNENEYIIRTVDEARIREAELNAAMYSKEMDLREKRCEGSRKFFKKRLVIYVILFAVGYFLWMLIGFDSSVGLAFGMLGMAGACGMIYGSIIHGIILLANRNKR